MGTMTDMHRTVTSAAGRALGATFRHRGATGMVPGADACIEDTKRRPAASAVNVWPPSPSTRPSG